LGGIVGGPHQSPPGPETIADVEWISSQTSLARSNFPSLCRPLEAVRLTVAIFPIASASASDRLQDPATSGSLFHNPGPHSGYDFM
jgi:hypothetical protein